jgi:hypothetical protein
MAKSPGKPAQKAANKERLHLPDPKIPTGPYRPFTSDPGWSEAWWWLGFPVLVALFVIGTYQFTPDFYQRYVIPEGYGILELSHFLMPLAGLFIAASLLLLPFVRARPLVFTVALIGGLTCLYIAGEEMSWGQHFFHWNTPDYWADVNRQAETNLHNTYAVFEKTPRAILELGILIGGLLVPLAAAFDPRVRANRLSLFLPPAALVPAAIGAAVFKYADILHARNAIDELVGRASETVETFLYFFILAYLIVYARRIKELEVAEHALPK